MEIAAESRGDIVDDFDVVSAKREFVQQSKALLIRNWWNFLVCKVLERLAVNIFDIRLADRLTKDVIKSHIRKLEKYSSREAASRIFRTALYTKVLPTIALFTVDCGYGLYNLYCESGAVGHNIINCRNGVRMTHWLLKRLGLYVCCAFFSAGGMMCSTRLNLMPKYSTLLIAALFETIGGEIYNASLGGIMRN